MTMMSFHVLFPEEARNEVRAIRIESRDLPDRTFLLTELYCVDPNCDCRRVILNAMEAETGEQVATISHSFEPPKPPFDDEPQTFLDPINPQSSISDALLDIFKRIIANDPDYQAGLERHYAMWKSAVDDPSHPDHAKVRSKLFDDPNFKPAFPRQNPVRREKPKVNPNALCPCGSGKKFKRCCRV
jgi:hypothetical protein